MTDATIDSDQWRPYHIAGVVLVPLGYRGKVPMIRGWTTTAFDRPEDDQGPNQTQNQPGLPL